MPEVANVLGQKLEKSLRKALPPTPRPLSPASHRDLWVSPPWVTANTLRKPSKSNPSMLCYAML